MKARIKYINETTKQVLTMSEKSKESWAVKNGYSTEFYEVEQACNGKWYLSGFAPVEPEPTPEAIAEEIKQARVLEINKELNEIDLKSIRPERSIRTGRGTDFDTQKLVELEDQADVLRAELQGLVIA